MDEVKNDMPEPEKASKACSMSCKKNATIAAVVVVVLIAVAGAYYGGFKLPFGKTISKEDAKAKVEKFIKDNGATATVEGVTEENGLYKVAVKVGTQAIDSYVTKDGTKLFPQAISLEEQPKNDNAQQANPGKATVDAKKDIPEVELFVMSYCPFGTQAEKGILPVLDTLGNKVKFSLKFVDYAMHPTQGEVEENLRQYCIQKEEPARLNAYLKCFLKKGGEAESKNCMKLAGVNTVKNSACYKATDTQFEIIKKKDDKSAWNGGQFPPFDVNKADNTKYSVQGSPTLVINGEVISTGRDPQSILTAVCSGFNKKPAECDKKLATDAPAAGFGDGTAAGGSAAASCGS